jgi:hypothetical protein
MSYVGGPFEYDVFVSYARSNEQGESRLKNWSVSFQHELTNDLNDRWTYPPDPKRPLRIYFDEHNLDRLGELTPQILEAAASSAMLLIIMTRDYIRSNWCRRELMAWTEKQTELNIPAHGRIAVIRVESTNEKLWEKWLKDRDGEALPGFFFHPRIAPGGGDVTGPFGGSGLVARDDADFQQAFVSASKAVWERLTLLKKGRDELLEQERAAQFVGPKMPWLYVHGREGQRADWDNLCEQLREGGFTVWPSTVDPVHKTPADEEKHYKERLDTMKRCDALFAMSTDNDAAFDNDFGHITRRTSEDLPRIPRGLLNAVVQPARTSMRRQFAKQFELRWIDSTLPNWTPEVRAWLDEVRTKNGARR